jgi:DNA-binding CsgD family transcriptional regulator
MAIMALYGGTTADALQHADAAVTAAERSGDPERLAHALGSRALAGVMAGEAAYRTFVERALALEPGLDAPPSIWSPTTVAAECARFALDLDEARRLSHVVLERAVESGNIELEWWAVFGSARAELLSGNASAARGFSDVAFELAEAMGRWRLPAITLRAELDAFAGRTEEGVAALRGVVAEAERLGERRWLRQARLALGRIALAEGDAGTAADELRAARRIAEEMGMRHPSTMLALADEAEAAEGAGRPEQADEALAIARDLGDPPSWAKQVLLRATAIRLAVRGELQEAESLLERARDMGPSPSLPLQQARIFLALGTLERRLRKRRLARESLQRAVEMFDEMGAVGWATTARAELGRIGGRTPAGSDLTPAEDRVANLVAEGMTNREVAAALVVSVHTVEAALTQVYRKLEVRSRTELVRRYADQPSKL